MHCDKLKQVNVELLSNSNGGNMQGGNMNPKGGQGGMNMSKAGGNISINPNSQAYVTENTIKRKCIYIEGGMIYRKRTR